MEKNRIMAKKKEPGIDELYKALDELGFKYEHSESHEGLEVVNFLVTPTDEDEENEDETENN
jgi:signal recognition particle subunit SEC65